MNRGIVGPARRAAFVLAAGSLLAPAGILHAWLAASGSTSPAAPPAAGAAAGGRLLVAGSPPSAWLLTSEGRLLAVGPGGGAPAAGSSFAEPGSCTDAALSRDGTALYTLAPDAEGRATLLARFEMPGARQTARWEVRGMGRFLALSADESRACVLGLERRAAKRLDDASPEDWILQVVDLATDLVAGPLALGLEPRAATFAAATSQAGGPGRLLVAGPDRIATFEIAPLRSSWFYVSPGTNLDLAASPDGRIVFVLRDSSLAVFDPARRVKEEGRVRLGADDATATVALPAPGSALVLARGGAMAAVLHEDGSAVTLVDTGAAAVVKTEPLREIAVQIATIVVDGGPAVQAVTAGGASIVVPVPEARAPAAAAPEEAAGPAAETALPREAAPELPAGGAESTPILAAPVAESLHAGDAPATDGGRSSEGADSASGREEEEDEKEEKAKDREPAMRDAPPAADPATAAGQAAPPASGEPPAPLQPPASTVNQPPVAQVEPDQPAAPRPTEGGLLMGRITGEVSAAREVLFHGPDNILKLHARARVGPDGSFSLPVPPPGTYRVVVRGEPGAHLFTRPELRSVRVEAGGTGLAGLDFEVRGRL